VGTATLEPALLSLRPPSLISTTKPAGRLEEDREPSSPHYIDFSELYHQGELNGL
jgi:hypothetical protein